MLISLCPVIERPGARTELSGDRAGVLGRVTVMRDRRLSTASPDPSKDGSATVRLALRSGGSALRGFFLQGSRASPVTYLWGAPVAVEPESEGLKAHNRRNGAPQGAVFSFGSAFRRPDLS